MAELVRLDPEFLSVPLAHRGLHDAKIGIIENSLSAFEAAISQGYGIELDVQMSADGEAMSFHDYELKRLTGNKGFVQLSTAQDLRSMELKGSSERIPDLRESLDLIAGRCPLLIEIKDQDGSLGANVGALETRVVDLVRGYDGPVALMSFNPHSVAAIAQIAPHIPRGRVTCAFDEWPNVKAPVLKSLQPISPKDGGGISFFSHDAQDLSSEHVASAKDAGLDVLCWTIRTQSEEADARKLAQNITFEGYQPLKPEA